jgi:hypothetical protein
MQDFEKLGVFYLGRAYNLDAKKAGDDLLLYDARHLTTHAVCVGMTGSGKTGLCIGLIEEAAIDGIPAIVIDPKGDLSNLLLTFPDLRPEDFRPWINEEDARSKDHPDVYAAQRAAVADRARRVGTGSGADPAAARGRRRRRTRRAAPACLPVSVPARSPARRAVLQDAEALRDLISGAVTGLLGLAGLDADPLQSREHILLSAILSAAWNAGRDLDLPSLIQSIQNPPMARVGVLELESFFPAKERFGLAMTINALLASPSFSGWIQGDPLDIDGILHGEAVVRDLIFSIAHLSDPGGCSSFLPAEPDGRVDARAVGDDLRARSTWTDLRLLPPVRTLRRRRRF